MILLPETLILSLIEEITPQLIYFKGIGIRLRIKESELLFRMLYQKKNQGSLNKKERQKTISIVWKMKLISLC